LVAVGQTNVYGAFLQDFTSATMELPEAGGCTTNVNSTICLDTIANRTHLWTNAGDSIAIANQASTTVTTGSGTSIASTVLCAAAACPVGTYRVNTYIDITTACGTSGTYIVNLIYTDDQGAKTVVINLNGTGSVPATGTLTTTSTANFGEDTQILRSTGATSINYSTTATACGTAGPMVGKLYLSIEQVQ
jgi:hypothetical protein